MGPTETETQSARERGGERCVILILFFVSNFRKRERETKRLRYETTYVPLMLDQCLKRISKSKK